MSCSFDHNCVVERRNRTLMVMVRIMRTHTKLPRFLLIETLKTIVYIVNRVLTKVVLKTLFDLFKGWKPNLRHIRL